MLDLRRLAALRAVAHHGSIAAAAASLHFTAPAVSQQLAALERDVGTPLLERAGRGVRLTDAGVTLAAHADVLLDQLALAEAAVATSRDRGSATVRLAAFPTAMATMVASAVAGEAAGIDVRAIEAEPDEALLMLQRREVDIAVVHHSDLLPRALPTVAQTHLLLEEPMWIVLPAGHPLVGPTIGLGELHDARWIAARAGGWCAELVQRVCGAAGFVPDVAVQSTDYAGVLAFVRAGAGVGLVPSLALRRADLDGLSFAAPDPPVHRYTQALATAPAGRSPSTDIVIAALATAAVDLPSLDPAGVRA